MPSVRGGRRQRADVLEHDRPHALVGIDHPRRLAALRDLHLDHVPALEGPVVGQRLGVLAGPQGRQLIEVAARDRGFGGHVLPRGQHRRAGPRVTGEAVQHPVSGNRRAARRRRRRIQQLRPVAGTVGGDHQLQARPSGDRAAGRGQARDRRGAGLADHRAAHRPGAQPRRQRGGAVEDVRLRDRPAQHQAGNPGGVDPPLGQGPGSDVGGQVKTGYLGQGALPLGEGRAPREPGRDRNVLVPHHAVLPAVPATMTSPGPGGRRTARPASTGRSALAAGSRIPYR